MCMLIRERHCRKPSAVSWCLYLLLLLFLVVWGCAAAAVGTSASTVSSGTLPLRGFSHLRQEFFFRDLPVEVHAQVPLSTVREERHNLSEPSTDSPGG